MKPLHRPTSVSHLGINHQSTLYRHIKAFKEQSLQPVLIANHQLRVRCYENSVKKMEKGIVAEQ